VRNSLDASDLRQKIHCFFLAIRQIISADFSGQRLGLPVPVKPQRRLENRLGPGRNFLLRQDSGWQIQDCLPVNHSDFLNVKESWT
jgi:hypothetical protein